MATEKPVLNKVENKGLPWPIKASIPVLLLFGSIAGFNTLSENASTATIPQEAKLPDFCLDTDQSPAEKIWCHYAQAYPGLKPVLDDPNTLSDETTQDITFDICLPNGRAATLADVSVLGKPTKSVNLMGRQVELPEKPELRPVWTTVKRGIGPTQVSGRSRRQELAVPFAVRGLDRAQGLQFVWLTENGEPFQLAAINGCLDGTKSSKDGSRLSLERSFFLPNF